MQLPKKILLISIPLVLIIIIFAGLLFVPIYSKSASGCKAHDTVVRSSLVGGSTKAKVDSQATAFVVYSSQYDCPISTVTYRLYIL